MVDQQPLPKTVQGLSDEVQQRFGLSDQKAMELVLDRLADIGYVNVAPTDPVKQGDSSSILALVEWTKMDSY